MAEPRNLAEMLAVSVKAYKKRRALYFEGKEISYIQLDESSNKLANGLRTLGLNRGDRIALMLPNIPEFVYSFFAIQKLGAVAVPFNTMYKGREILHILNDCGARAIITLSNFVNLINEIRPDVPTLDHVILTGERTLIFVHPESTLAIQLVFDKRTFGSADGAFSHIGEVLVKTLQRFGVAEAWYKHRGSVRVGGHKIATFIVSEVENLAIANGLVFIGPLPTDELFRVIYVPAEVKDKVLEPLTSIQEQTGSRPRPEEFRDALVELFENALGVEVKPGALKRDELFGYEKVMAQALKSQ